MDESNHIQKDAEREAADDKMVNEAYQQLLNSYMVSPHRKKVDIINKAFNFARQAHKGVRRLSGEPYIMHPISVALIASAEMGLGSTSICSALLHDVVEDTDYTVEDIETIFGSKIAPASQQAIQDSWRDIIYICPTCQPPWTKQDKERTGGLEFQV